MCFCDDHMCLYYSEMEGVGESSVRWVAWLRGEKERARSELASRSLAPALNSKQRSIPPTPTSRAPSRPPQARASRYRLSQGVSCHTQARSRPGRETLMIDL